MVILIPLFFGVFLDRMIVPTTDWNPSLGIAAGYLLTLPTLLRSVRRYNRDVYSKAIQKWNSSLMCRTCGTIHEMLDQASAAAKTG
jgi:hypothetical protein